MQLFTSYLKHTKKIKNQNKAIFTGKLPCVLSQSMPCEVNDRSWSRLDVSVRKCSGNIFQSAWLTSLSYFKEQELYEAC